MEYIIGSGAILENGANGGITPAALHAHVGELLARRVRAAAVDFEGTTPATLQRLLAVIQGATPAESRKLLEEPLRTRGDCSLADVLEVLATAAGTREVHLFAHWVPGEETLEDLGRRGLALVNHPLESIQAAAMVSGQRHRRVA